MILIGELSLWVALLMAAWAATVSFAGGALDRRDLTLSGERAIYATLAMVVLASLGLWTALFTHDFSIKYVASFSSANLPKVYTFTAFWAGQAGSMLFCWLWQRTSPSSHRPESTLISASFSRFQQASWRLPKQTWWARSWWNW